MSRHYILVAEISLGAADVEWLSSWLMEQGDRGLATWFQRVCTSWFKAATWPKRPLSDANPQYNPTQPNPTERDVLLKQGRDDLNNFERIEFKNPCLKPVSFYNFFIFNKKREHDKLSCSRFLLKILSYKMTPVYSVWFFVFQLFWLLVFGCKDVCPQASIQSF